MTAKQVLATLRTVACEERAVKMPMYVNAVPGGYGEGDQFLGCAMPDQRRIVRESRDLSQGELVKLFASPWHVRKFEE